MRKLILTVFLSVYFVTAHSQSLPDFSSIKLEVKEDYNDNANNAALIAADYLLNTAFDRKDKNRLLCTVYLVKWMAGSPDYNFEFGEKMIKLSKKNEDILLTIMAGMTKFVLENKPQSKDSKAVLEGAIKHLANYILNEKSNLRANSEIKKMLEAYKNNKLSEYLNN